MKCSGSHRLASSSAANSSAWAEGEESQLVPSCPVPELGVCPWPLPPRPVLGRGERSVILQGTPRPRHRASL